MYCVYKHTSPSGKVYIGLTKQNPLDRWRGGFGYKGNTLFWRAIVKYGWDNFKHEIIASGLTRKEASEKEVELIKKYNSTNSDFGYNLTKGGEGGRLGLLHTEETKKKMSAANQTRWNAMSDDRKEQEKERCRHLFEGHKHTAYSNEKNMLNNPKRRKVVQYSLSGIRLQEYMSIREAEKKNNIKHPMVSYCVNGKVKTAGGFIWKCE